MTNFLLSLTHLVKGVRHTQWPLYPNGSLEQVDLVECGVYQLVYEGETSPILRVLDAEVPPSLVEKEVHQDGGHAWYRTFWRIELKDYAGETTLSLWDDQNLIWYCSFEIRPLATKLSQNAYMTMLDQIPNSLSSLLQGLGNVQLKWQEGDTEASTLASLIAIKMYREEVEKAFRQVVLEAQRELVSESARVPFHAVKRMSQASLRHVARHSAWRETVHTETQGKASFLVPSVTKVETYATPANRFFKYLLTCLLERCVLLEEKLRYAFGSEKQDFAKQRLLYFQNMTQDFGKQLVAVAASTFFSQLEPALSTSSALQAISGHPAYARFYRMTSSILNPQLNLSLRMGDMDIPTIPTWHIYEYWVFVRVASLLQGVLPDLKWSRISRWDERGVVRTFDEEPFFQMRMSGTSQEAGVEVHLTYQEKFPAYHSTRDLPKKRAITEEDFRSIGKAMIPDLFVRVRRGAETKAMVLDAKYRTSELAINESLEKMHAYKNGLRHGDKPISGAFIVVPAFEERVAAYFSTEYREQFQFGGFCLHPTEEDDQQELREWLRRWVHEWEEEPRSEKE